MRILTVARKPLAGSVAANTLKWGTGGINIDGTRISTPDELKDGAGGLLSNVRDAREWGYPAGPDDNGYSPSSLGRWPANLILQHLLGCACIGMKQVSKGGGNGAATKNRHCPNTTVTIGTPIGFLTPHYDSDGNESVADWDCDPHCPVGSLDAEVGPLKSGTVKPWYRRNSSGGGGYHGHFGEVPLSGFGDTGGASRFFKQVRGTEAMTMAPDLIEYLTTMISSPDGKAVYVEDLGFMDFTDIPDNSLYGLIAGGRPTDAQVKAAMKALRPGAHFLLIAPESQPTGHTGACLLEDNGFDIRDSILLVTEPGRLHYVPKASRSEREAGCFGLPSKSGTKAVDREEDTAGLDNPRAGRTAESVHNFHPCLRPDALVMTDLGYRPIGEIQRGTQVYSADGCFHRVEEVSRHPYTSEFLYEIFVRGTNYTTPASDNHPFLIWRPTRKDKRITGGEVGWIAAEDIRKGDYTMSPILQETETQGPWEEDYWFLFGLWLAEGIVQCAGKGHGSGLYPSFSLHENETDLVQRIRDFFSNSRGKNISIYPKKDCHGIQVTAFDPGIGAEFLRLGGKGAATKQIHPDVFSLPRNYRKAIVHGHLAGDGGLVRTYWQSKTVSPDLAAQLRLLSESVGYKANLFWFKAQPGHIGNRVFKRTLPTYQIQLYARDLDHKGGSGRKPSRPTTLEYEGTSFFLNYVQAVLRTPYKGEVVNLTVEGSPTFQTAVGISHNTVKAIDLMTRLLADVPKDQGPVLDPFLGSGTTLISCLETGHDAIGIEREEEYIRIADARIRFWDREIARRGGTVIESDYPKAPKAEEVDFLDLLMGE